MDAADLLEGEQVTIIDADNRPIDLGHDPAFVPADAAELVSPR
jgi:aspartate 1-decarboxylase